jgi:hypothetical protein
MTKDKIKLTAEELKDIISTAILMGQNYPYNSTSDLIKKMCKKIQEICND